MPQEHLDYLRLAYEAANRGDPSVFLDRYDPNIELHVSGSAIEPGTYRGRREVISYWTGVLETWDTVSVEPKDKRDRVGSVVRQDSHPPHHSRPLSTASIGCSFSRGFPTGFPEDALEAAGLSEQDAHADP